MLIPFIIESLPLAHATTRLAPIRLKSSMLFCSAQSHTTLAVCICISCSCSNISSLVMPFLPKQSYIQISFVFSCLVVLSDLISIYKSSIFHANHITFCQFFTHRGLHFAIPHHRCAMRSCLSHSPHHRCRGRGSRRHAAEGANHARDDIESHFVVRNDYCTPRYN